MSPPGPLNITYCNVTIPLIVVAKDQGTSPMDICDVRFNSDPPLLIQSLDPMVSNGLAYRNHNSLKADTFIHVTSCNVILIAFFYAT